MATTLAFNGYACGLWGVCGCSAQRSIGFCAKDFSDAQDLGYTYAMKKHLIYATWIFILIYGCSDSGDDAAAGPNDSPGEVNRDGAGVGFSNLDDVVKDDTVEEAPNGCGDIPATVSGSQCFKLKPTSSHYAVKAHPDCSKEGESCSLLVVLNTQDGFFKYADTNKTIVVRSFQEMDGNDAKHPLALIPRVIAARYPGLDRQRIYIAGYSAGAGGVFRGLCQSVKKYDQSEFGTTSDIYAAMAVAGNCPNCAEDFTPISGRWHVLAVNGMLDVFADAKKDIKHCYQRLTNLARTNGCSAAENAEWYNVSAKDRHMQGGDGSDIAQKLSFGNCESGGDVVGYRFKDENHDPSYKKNFDLEVRAYDMIWEFLQGRTKSGNSTSGAGDE